ncbi:hypothetical protein [Methylocystis rosea]|nr:hypothetical protein [Methylocystis rosea]
MAMPQPAQKQMPVSSVGSGGQSLVEPLVAGASPELISDRD